MFTLDEVKAATKGAADLFASLAAESAFYDELKAEVGTETEKICGPISKLTVFNGSPLGAVAIKFGNPRAAALCVDLFEGRYFAGRSIEAAYFDGTTNYKVEESEAAANARHDAFGAWLEKQE
jgi:HIV Tat-specific factor 1